MPPGSSTATGTTGGALEPVKALILGASGAPERGTVSITVKVTAPHVVSKLPKRGDRGGDAKAVVPPRTPVAKEETFSQLRDSPADASHFVSGPAREGGVTVGGSLVAYPGIGSYPP